MTQNVLFLNKHILICLEDKFINHDYHYEFDYVKSNFCGTVMLDNNNTSISKEFSSDILIYLCGNVKLIYDTIKYQFKSFVIKELSYNYDKNQEDVQLISLGQVPINIHNVGVYFRKFFDDDKNYFELVNNEHEFQSLTESNKSGQALRKGIYLSNVVKINDDEIKFNLLRCSTNLSGPTENFGLTDHLIINQINSITKHFFTEDIKFNHVLAQVYENHSVVTNNKKTERKAVIKAHSDKTKDMTISGLISFNTFYKDYVNNNFSKINKDIKTGSSNDYFNHTYNNHSVLTRLHFKLKDCVNDSTLIKNFSVTLYPNSIFIIPLSTNRLYTHEIKSSTLPIDKIPVRLGYVSRCSKTEAVFKNGQTYIVNNNNYIQLVDMSEEGLGKLRDLYYEENVSDQIINYGNFDFSMNQGDYKQPKI